MSAARLERLVVPLRVANFVKDAAQTQAVVNLDVVDFPLGRIEHEPEQGSRIISVRHDLVLHNGPVERVRCNADEGQVGRLVEKACRCGDKISQDEAAEASETDCGLSPNQWSMLRPSSYTGRVPMRLGELHVRR